MGAPKLDRITLKTLLRKDDAKFLELQSRAFGGLEYLPRVRTHLPYLDRHGSFVAERGGSAIGCIGLYRLQPRSWFEIGQMAVRNASELPVARKLLAKVLSHVDSERPRYLKASTPAVQPYVDLYKAAGFESVRRIIRIGWDLRSLALHGQAEVRIEKIPKPLADDAARVWTEGLRPYWNWWIKEQGGPKVVGAWVRESVAKSQAWTGAFIGDELVGVARLRPDSYGRGIGRFNGAYVLPRFRERGAGSALMKAILLQARRLHQKEMKIYTVAFLDHLAPGAILYMKHGGKIEAEYLELQKAT